MEGKKGEQAAEWRNGSQEVKDYNDFDIEGRKRAIDFIRRSAEAKKPFYVAWWPLWMSFIPSPQKSTLQRGLVGESYQRVTEPDIALLRETLEETQYEFTPTELQGIYRLVPNENSDTTYIRYLFRGKLGTNHNGRLDILCPF